MSILSRAIRKLKRLRRQYCSPFSHGWVIYHSRILNLQLLLNRDSYIDYLIWLEGSYSQDLLDTLKQIVQEHHVGLFFDIGANIGEVSLYLKKAFPQLKVYAFEPVFDNYVQHAMEKILNGLEYELFHTALGNTDGELVLHTPRANLSTDYQKFNAGMFSILEDGSREAEKPLRVPCHRFDTFVQTHALRLDAPALFKLDVEGAELDVLRGMQATLAGAGVPLILIVELNLSRDNVYREVVAYLTGLEYKMYSLDGKPVFDTAALTNGDYIFMKS
ncbi:MAG: FkbM family methyltransferase [Chloroflexi bacterium]|jgi:FkbM family methyltransferase|nr:FkbM family methyltransferase [Chloroflexota bacterium]